MNMRIAPAVSGAVFTAALAFTGVAQAATGNSKISTFYANDSSSVHESAGSISRNTHVSSTTFGLSGGQNVGPGALFGTAWVSSAAQQSRGVGVISGYRIKSLRLAKGVYFDGSLSVGFTQIQNIGTPGSLLGDLGYFMRVGPEWGTGFIEHTALRAGSGSQTVSAPIVFGYSGAVGLGRIAEHGSLSYKAAALVPQYHLPSGDGIRDGQMLELGYSYKRMSTSVTWITGLDETGPWISSGGTAHGSSDNYSVRQTILAWPILPGDPAASYQRGVTISGAYAATRDLTLSAAVHVGKKVHASGSVSGLAYNERISTTGFTLSAAYRF